MLLYILRAWHWWQTVCLTHTFSNLHALHCRTLAAASSAYQPVLLYRCTSWTQWSNLCIQRRLTAKILVYLRCWVIRARFVNAVKQRGIYRVYTDRCSHQTSPVALRRISGTNFARHPCTTRWRMCSTSTYLYNAINWLLPHSSKTLQDGVIPQTLSCGARRVQTKFATSALLWCIVMSLHNCLLQRELNSVAKGCVLVLTCTCNCYPRSSSASVYML